MGQVMPEELAEVSVTDTWRERAFALFGITHRVSEFDQPEFIIRRDGLRRLSKQAGVMTFRTGWRHSRVRARCGLRDCLFQGRTHRGATRSCPLRSNLKSK